MMLITFKLSLFTEVGLILMSFTCHIYYTYTVYYTYIIDLYALYCSDNILLMCKIGQQKSFVPITWDII